MSARVARLAAKISAAGLADDGAALFGVLDGGIARLAPREPYRGMMALLAARSGGAIRPDDAEARAILREIPVADAADADGLARGRSGHGCVVLADGSAVVIAAATPDEAFVSFSSACFACYVKFVADALAGVRGGAALGAKERRLLALAFDPALRPPEAAPKLARGPFDGERAAREAMVEAGRATVRLGLVGASFGNLSYAAGGRLHISRAGAALDEIEEGVVSVRRDGSGAARSEASSELAVHLGILDRTRASAVLHGHPRHAVIASLDCDRDGCPGRGACHQRCDERRSAAGAPIVPGEEGAGPRGSRHAVPDALVYHPAAIVYGHGVFTTGAIDFTDALQSLVDVERKCFDEIAKRLL
jgi:ribulose-5-phosphate 4-epimerase/fuculose-1-phosphate aldolase